MILVHIIIVIDICIGIYTIYIYISIYISIYIDSPYIYSKELWFFHGPSAIFPPMPSLVRTDRSSWPSGPQRSPWPLRLGQIWESHRDGNLMGLENVNHIYIIITINNNNNDNNNNIYILNNLIYMYIYMYINNLIYIIWSYGKCELYVGHIWKMWDDSG